MWLCGFGQFVSTNESLIFCAKNLVWSGYGRVGPWNTHNIHVCTYLGRPHICMFVGNQNQGYARGHALILNTDYEIVASVQSGDDATDLDQHEFRLVNGQTALVTIYQQIQYDLTAVGISTNQGWIMDSVFQEVNITDGSVVFEWSALAHVDPLSTYVKPKSSDVSGDGLTSQTGWDFLYVQPAPYLADRC